MFQSEAYFSVKYIMKYNIIDNYCHYVNYQCYNCYNQLERVL